MTRERRQRAAAPPLRAGEPRACLGTLARNAGAAAVEAHPDLDCGLEALAESFADAADRSAHIELGDALRGRLVQLDLPTTLFALRHLLGAVCLQTGETPRTILEAEFVNAPSDDWWRANLEAVS